MDSYLTVDLVCIVNKLVYLVFIGAELGTGMTSAVGHVLRELTFYHNFSFS